MVSHDYCVVHLASIYVLRFVMVNEKYVHSKRAQLHNLSIFTFCMNCRLHIAIRYKKAQFHCLSHTMNGMW